MTVTTRNRTCVLRRWQPLAWGNDQFVGVVSRREATTLRGCRLPPVPGRKKTGCGEFRFFIADDIKEARRARRLVEQRLVFNIVYATVRDRFAFSLNGRRIPRAAFTAKFMASDPLPADRPMPPYMQFAVDLAKLRDVRMGWNTLRADVLGGDDAYRPSDMYRGLDIILFEAELVLRYR